MSDVNSLRHLKSYETKDSIKNPSKYYSEDYLKDSTAPYTSINDTSSTLEYQGEIDPITTQECGDTFIDCDESINIEEFLSFNQPYTNEESMSDHQNLKIPQNCSESVSHQGQEITMDELEHIDPNMVLIVRTYSMQNSSYINERISDLPCELGVDITNPELSLPSQFVNINKESGADSKKKPRKPRKPRKAREKREFKTHKKRKLNMLRYFHDNSETVMKKAKRDSSKPDLRPRKYPKKQYYQVGLTTSFKKFGKVKKLDKKYEDKGENQKKTIKVSFDDLLRHCNNNNIFSKIASANVLRTYNSKEIKKKISKGKKIREAFKKYIDTIFLEKSPNKLAKIFGFYCCENKTLVHNHECREKWRKLQEFSYSELIGSLRLRN
ncbi:hypothetical protein SteCoe_30966 [Stentor coeruleus]|uniref:Uncharacterized protein n=1 Tax=Stentor coeruleus TaxID=5963 RepID=A0A1R2B2D8_9CILI|nr:hypothetical protein SteCoe_30966 [Stentor coeruleus]